MENKLVSILRNNWWQLGLMGIGVIVLGIGMGMTMKETKGEELVVEKSTSQVSEVSGIEMRKVVVDIEGAVERPGVYELKQGDRVADAVIAAGGLAAKADRSYVARFINQASLVTDGMKIFIPALGDQTQQEQSNGLSVKSEANDVVSINTASESELDSLWGIGAARAKTIVENRPYSSVEELITKAKLTQEILDKNKDKIGL